MTPVRCKYCGRFYPRQKDKDKCSECEKEYKVILELLINGELQ